MKKNNFFYFFFLPFILILTLTAILIPIPKMTPPDRTVETEIAISTFETLHLEFKRGDSFYQLLLDNGIPSAVILNLNNILRRNSVNTSRFAVGTILTLFLENDELFGIDFYLPRRKDEYFSIFLKDDRWEFSTNLMPYIKKIIAKEFHIRSSLFQAIYEGEEKDLLAIKLIDILKWDVDFFKDIHKDDVFKIIFEKIEREDDQDYGRIIAAIYRGRVISTNAYFFSKDDIEGYFDEKANGKIRSFLKYPLKFQRISSGFTKRRFHPILKVYRPHQGIDYAAPQGTPVWSLGDGVVKRMGWGDGAGKSVTIEHKNGYESIYNHFSRYARGLHRGKRVKMGEVIGYVGMTGLATGPHLDFRMRKNGVWINPNHVKREEGRPLPAKYKKEFTDLRSIIDNVFESFDNNDDISKLEEIFQ